MKQYYYKCSDCGKEYSAEEIEKNSVYLCPACGKAEKNRPLRGVLSALYDYENLAEKYTRDFFLRLKPGKFWDYAELFPLDTENGKVKNIDDEILKRLALSENPVLEYEYDEEKILLMDETRNPTFSYKDRATALVALKALQMKIGTIAAASTGNAGSSLAGIAARVGLKSIIYAPKNIPEAKRIQIEAFGAQLTVVDGDYDAAFDACLEDSAKNGWYNRNTAFNPLTIEGKKSAAFDIFIATKGNLPENIFVPTGDGVIIAGVYKGFFDLLQLGVIEKIPRLIAVQAKGSDAVVRFLQSGKFEYIPAQTVADSISAGAPRNLFLAAKAVRETDGFAVAVSDDEILSAQKEIARKFGILCEPSSASTFAAFKAAREKIGSQKNLLLITGNGLKDIEAIKRWV
jgi:threonine synthase